jgi:murein L,D-transpeptidase YcbB/YkuD
MTHRGRFMSGVVAFALVAGRPGAAGRSGVSPSQATADVPAAIHAIVAGQRMSVSGPFAPGEREPMTALYAPGADAPLWVDASGRPGRDAHDALALLTHAADEGLDPADYAAAVLQRAATALEAMPAPAPDVAAFDTGLSVSTLRYLQHVHQGRVDPRAIGFRMHAPPDNHDFAAILREALADHRIPATAADFTPPLAVYRNLRSVLARYRLLAADATIEAVPPPGAPVHPGGPYPGARALVRRLVVLGDLPANTSVPALSPQLYDGALVDGVKHFQMRHGLDADGVLGRATQAALNVPLAWRVRQIELALERLRWLPHLGDERFVAVNIPMFRLWAWNAIPPDGAPSFETGVIVGRALNTQTPVFVEEMRYIIFRPYWNVPPSILRHEILPALARNPDYLRRHDMEVVSAPGKPLRVRQRPGVKNSLGLVKFVFPNDDNVYLHGTPVPALFSRARRDFSHGCVRVEDPVALAEWALADQPEWTRDRILAAMHADASRRVDLARPIRVILFYITAVVTSGDGTIRFADDIYGHDTKLDRMLRRPPAP